MFQIFQIVSSKMDPEKLILPVLSISVFYLYVMIANAFAQQVIDHNNHVFTTV